MTFSHRHSPSSPALAAMTKKERKKYYRVANKRMLSRLARADGEPLLVHLDASSRIALSAIRLDTGETKKAVVCRLLLAELERAGRNSSKLSFS